MDNIFLLIFMNPLTIITIICCMFLGMERVVRASKDKGEDEDKKNKKE